MNDKDTKRFWKHVQKSEGDGCYLWLAGKDDAGYGFFALKGKNCRAHRVAWEMENGPIPPGYKVCHHCDNPSCVRVSHLFLGTDSDNMKDMVAKGRMFQPHARGETNGKAKLTEQAVKEIRQLRAAGETNVSIANRYKIHKYYVTLIVQRKVWAHVA